MSRLSGGKPTEASAVQTERLCLVPMGVDILQALAEGDTSRAATLLDCTMGSEFGVPADLARIRLEQLSADATLSDWLLRAMIRSSDRAMIGYIGFHTAPGADYLVEFAPDGVEIGYTVYEPFRRCGYAYEAASALMAWAHRCHGVNEVIASVSPENAASLAVLQKLGREWRLQHVGGYDDPQDGYEDVYVLQRG